MPHLEDPHPVFVAGLECSGEGVAAGQGGGWGVGVRDVDEDHLGEVEVGGGLRGLCTAGHVELKSIKSGDEATLVSRHLTDDSRCFPSGDTTNIVCKGTTQIPESKSKSKIAIRGYKTARSPEFKLPYRPVQAFSGGD